MTQPEPHEITHVDPQPLIDNVNQLSNAAKDVNAAADPGKCEKFARSISELMKAIKFMSAHNDSISASEKGTAYDKVYASDEEEQALRDEICAFYDGLVAAESADGLSDDPADGDIDRH